MADWTAHPEEIRRWSPVAFDLEDLRSSRLTAGTRTRVTGKLAGVSMGGLTGRLVANATSALLSAGALDGATGRIARAAETSPAYALAA